MQNEMEPVVIVNVWFRAFKKLRNPFGSAYGEDYTIQGFTWGPAIYENSIESVRFSVRVLYLHMHIVLEIVKIWVPVVLLTTDWAVRLGFTV